MLFNSIDFAVFLVITYALYWASQGRLRTQNVVLLVAAYVFYGWWDWRFLVLLFLNCIVDWGSGLWLERTTQLTRRRLILAISVAANLAVLAYFKYFNFFADSAAVLLESLGMRPSWTFINIVLPVGISFYTFQSLSYTIDIYRRRLTATNDLLAFLVFHSFFPQLVAGPIERAAHLLPQCEAPRRFDADQAADGARQMLWGFFKKLVIADRLAPIVDAAFSSPLAASGSAELLLVLIFFSVQIYCDFSGYTDIAIGVSRLFGFRLARNFATPYFSRSIAEFWRRWHISLSSWFRDYVYIPLGGSRGSRLLTARNIMITFALSGLWHGANWTFLVWGVLHGAALVLSVIWKRHEAPSEVVAAGRWLPSAKEGAQMLATFAFVTLAWTFFRAPSITAAGEYFAAMASKPLELGGVSAYLTTTLLCAAMFVVEWLQRSREHGLKIAHLPSVPRYALAYAVGILLLTLGALKSAPFIYFQF